MPSRIHEGKFYALPQSPQQLKQLLMVAGYEKYFQIARCFRDEDQRGDRQPEFTQLDLEMSWVDQNDILDLTEELFTTLVQTVTPDIKVITPWPRLTYQECLQRFGSDKPDLRFGLEIKDIEPAVKDSEFEVFKRALSGGGCVRALAAPGCAGYSRRQIDDLAELARSFGAGGLVTIALGSGESDGSLDTLTMEQVRSSAQRFLTIEQVRGIAELTGAKMGDLILVVAGPVATTQTTLGNLRTEMGKRLELADPKVMAFARVTDFPLVEWDEADQRWDAAHHPFTRPHVEDMHLLDNDPGAVRAEAYDMVCNGYEVASGSIRIHDQELQQKVFQLLGYSREETQERFGAHAGGLRVRRSAPRRHCPRHRPDCDAASGRAQHPGGHRVPQEPERHGHDDGRAVCSGRAPAAGPAHCGGGRVAPHKSWGRVSNPPPSSPYIAVGCWGW